MSKSKTVDIDSDIDDVDSALDEIKDESDWPWPNDDEIKENEIIKWYDTGTFHCARCVFVNKKLHTITYVPRYPSPDKDLKYILERYAQGQEWHNINPGYMFLRKDKKIQVGCSTMPWIVVSKMWFDSDNDKGA